MFTIIWREIWYQTFNYKRNFQSVFWLQIPRTSSEVWSYPNSWTIFGLQIPNLVFLKLQYYLSNEILALFSSALICDPLVTTQGTYLYSRWSASVLAPFAKNISQPFFLLEQLRILSPLSSNYSAHSFVVNATSLLF